MPRAPIQRKRVCRLIEQDNRSFSEVLNHLHAIVQKHPKCTSGQTNFCSAWEGNGAEIETRNAPGEHTVDPTSKQKATIIQRRWAETVRVYRSRRATEGVDG